MLNRRRSDNTRLRERTAGTESRKIGRRPRRLACDEKACRREKTTHRSINGPTGKDRTPLGDGARWPRIHRGKRTATPPAAGLSGQPNASQTAVARCQETQQDHNNLFFGLKLRSGGDGSRTHDLSIANAALSQLSYAPVLTAVGSWAHCRMAILVVSVRTVQRRLKRASCKNRMLWRTGAREWNNPQLELPGTETARTRRPRWPARTK